MHQDGLVDTGVDGVQMFRVTEAVRCTPAVYEPTLVAVVSGTKEAIIDGTSRVYDSSRYMCCAISMPVEAGTPMASPDSPLLGVQIALDARVMTELAIEMENAAGAIREPQSGPLPRGSLSLAGMTGLPMRCYACSNSSTTQPKPLCLERADFARCTTPC